MPDFDELFERLASSDFRRKFHLGKKDMDYLQNRGLDEVALHADQFILQRLAPANPAKDGKQTPYRGHPVFVAQHATGTCCRTCLSKWHGLRKGVELNTDERSYIVSVIREWLSREISR